MRNIIIKTVLSIFLASTALAANAASITLTPSSPTVAAGDVFSVELYLDAADQLSPGQVTSEFSGLVELRFDSEFVDFTGFSFSSPAIELQAVTVTPSGDDDIVVFGFENAAEVGVIGTYNFVVNDTPDPLPGLGTIITFDAYDAKELGIFDSFANELGSNQTFPLTPEVASTSVSVVPLPAALVFLLSAFATLVPAARARKRN